MQNEQEFSGEAVINSKLQFVGVTSTFAHFHSKAARDFAGNDVKSIVSERYWNRFFPVYRALIERTIETSTVEFKERLQTTSQPVLFQAKHSICRLGVVEHIAIQPPQSSCPRSLVNHNFLTNTEQSILAALGRGLSTKEISRILNQSCHTVSTHRKNICRKLAVHSTAELVLVANEYLQRRN